jgi:hypothetical protein
LSSCAPGRADSTAQLFIVRWISERQTINSEFIPIRAGSAKESTQLV